MDMRKMYYVFISVGYRGDGGPCSLCHLSYCAPPRPKWVESSARSRQFIRNNTLYHSISSTGSSIGNRCALSFACIDRAEGSIVSSWPGDARMLWSCAYLDCGLHDGYP